MVSCGVVWVNMEFIEKWVVKWGDCYEYFKLLEGLGWGVCYRCCEGVGGGDRGIRFSLGGLCRWFDCGLEMNV